MNSPSRDNVTRVLSQDAFSLSLHGLVRADGAQLGANNPCEDRLNRAHPISLWEGEKWIAATVFDGHVGWQTADHLEKNLQNPDTLWEVEAFSEDQNCANEAEIARINREHPNEDISVSNGRVLGLAVFCRAFGNFRWKSSYDMQLEFSKIFMSCSPNKKKDILTPPYLVATPVVTVRKLKSELPSFVVLATDGLWYNFENYEMTAATVSWKKEPLQEPRTTIEDDNVAVHLMRNALGGNHRELLAGHLAFRAPFARDVRDDIIIQVLFFPGARSKQSE
ncbi:hypothetical protein NLG97_g1782 [Lecanicillium saksenae]|uniref:Uncharacterized protein n=1 Tax=Lecanicillium saksenae TaxID=468837 RepID=A0ACC1R4I8_9HYPO|nr:hypothetical protein NLG97_g1782 [Lecanicillium saksenae]